MTLTFDWTQSVASVGIIRVGLFNISSPKSSITADNWNNNTVAGSFDGYYTFVRDNNNSGNRPRDEAATFQGATGLLFAGTDLNTTNNTQFDLSDNGTTTYNVTFSVTRAASQISTQFLIMEGATERFNVTATDSASPYTTFDFGGIRGGGGTMTLDNLSVTVVPEPSTWALLVGGLAALVALRRRR